MEINKQTPTTAADHRIITVGDHGGSTVGSRWNHGGAITVKHSEARLSRWSTVNLNSLQPPVVLKNLWYLCGDYYMNESQNTWFPICYNVFWSIWFHVDFTFDRDHYFLCALKVSAAFGGYHLDISQNPPFSRRFLGVHRFYASLPGPARIPDLDRSAAPVFPRSGPPEPGLARA